MHKDNVDLRGAAFIAASPASTASTAAVPPAADAVGTAAAKLHVVAVLALCVGMAVAVVVQWW
jgi:hypothetical protein